MYDRQNNYNAVTQSHHSKVSPFFQWRFYITGRDENPSDKELIHYNYKEYMLKNILNTLEAGDMIENIDVNVGIE